MRESVSLLWTGGWDSTFRLVELSFEDLDIYPVYVVDQKRKSHKIELQKMQEIVAALKNKPLTKAYIHDVEIVERSAIEQDAKITEAYRIVNEKTHLGSQHEWLARLGKTRPGLELGTEAGNPETSHIIHAIEEFGKLVIENNVGVLDPERSSEEGMLVLGWFRFPLITRTEGDMLQLIKQWGYEDIMQNIWFCHTPIDGQPCGLCHPCEVKMESKMEFLLPQKAQKRYKVYRFCTRSFGKFGENCARKLLRHI